LLYRRIRSILLFAERFIAVSEIQTHSDSQESTFTLENTRHEFEVVRIWEQPATASAILAGLKCENDIIYQILRRDIMQESSVYRSIFAEG
jgi:hypothetical protein